LKSIVEKKGSYLNFTKIKNIASKLAKKEKTRRVHTSATKKYTSVKRNTSQKYVLSDKKSVDVKVKKVNNISKPKVDPLEQFLSKQKMI